MSCCPCSSVRFPQSIEAMIFWSNSSIACSRSYMSIVIALIDSSILSRLSRAEPHCLAAWHYHLASIFSSLVLQLYIHSFQVLTITYTVPVRPGTVFLSPCRGDDPFTGQIIDCSSPLKSYTDAFVSHSRFEYTVLQPGAVFLYPLRR